MKCENCGKNDVSFVYQSNINGHVEEKHLCASCAAKLGYSQKLAAQSQRMMQSFMDGFGSFGGFFDGTFDSMPRLLGRMVPLLEDPFDDFFADMPALGAAQETQEQQKKDGLVDNESQSRFSRMRELNALRSQMHKAIRKEDFERAAQLRDQIHALEEKKE